MTGRAEPFYCPFCAGEDLRPYGTRHGSWLCRCCARAFQLSLVGIQVGPRDTAPAGLAGDDPQSTAPAGSPGDEDAPPGPAGTGTGGVPG